MSRLNTVGTACGSYITASVISPVASSAFIFCASSAFTFCASSEVTCSPSTNLFLVESVEQDTVSKITNKLKSKRFKILELILIYCSLNLTL